MDTFNLGVQPNTTSLGPRVPASGTTMPPRHVGDELIKCLTDDAARAHDVSDSGGHLEPNYVGGRTGCHRGSRFGDACERGIHLLFAGAWNPGLHRLPGLDD